MPTSGKTFVQQIAEGNERKRIYDARTTRPGLAMKKTGDVTLPIEKKRPLRGGRSLSKR